MKKILSLICAASVFVFSVAAQEEALQNENEIAQEEMTQEEPAEKEVAQAEEPEADEPAEEKPMVLTVQDAVDYAIKNSRDLKSLDIDLAIAKRAKNTAWNVFVPDVSASFTAARTTDIQSTLDQQNSAIASANAMGRISSMLSGAQYTPVEPIAAQEKYHWALRGNINASLTFSIAYIQQIRSAKASYESGKITWEQSMNQTLMNIKKLFYGLLLQQESLSLQRASLENARQRAEQAAINYRNGRIPEIQMLNAQVTYENKMPEVQMAEQSLRQQFDTFAFLLGLPVGTQIELSGSIEPEYIEVETEDLLAKYGENNLNIRQLQSNIDSLKLSLSALNFGIYSPSLILSYDWSPTGTWWTGDLEWADNKGVFSATLYWNITNMLPFSSNQKQARDLKGNLAKLELTMETLRENQKVQVRSAVDKLNQAREQIDSMERTVTLAERSYNMAVNQYNNGRMELLDLRDAENQLNQARLGQLNQRFNYISALMDLEFELNTDLSEYKE